MKKAILLISFLLLPFSLLARVDVQCIVRTSYHKKVNDYGAFRKEYSDEVKCTVSFISGAEFKLRRPSTEKYAIIWFSNEQCAVIKLDPDRITSVESLSVTDLPDITGGSGLVFGEKDNEEDLDDTGLPVVWEFNFNDRNNHNEYVDPRLQRIWMSNNPLFI